MSTPAYEGRPIQESVISDEGSWKNRYRNRKVTPPIPDYVESSSPITICGRIRKYFQGLKEELNSPLSDAAQALRNRPPIG